MYPVPRSDLPDQTALEPAPYIASPLYYPAPVPSRARSGFGLGLLVGLLLGLPLLLFVLMGALIMLPALSMAGWGGRTVSQAGEQVSSTVRAAAEAVGATAEEARDRLDPSHPPRGPLVYDAEIDDFVRLGVGQSLSGSKTRSLALGAIRPRDEGGSPELARYAVFKSELRQPNETKVLGLTVRKDSDPREEYLYQGETFRLGGQLYKINWISLERQQIALIQLRNPDRAAVRPKFSYE